MSDSPSLRCASALGTRSKAVSRRANQHQVRDHSLATGRTWDLTPIFLRSSSRIQLPLSVRSTFEFHNAFGSRNRQYPKAKAASATTQGREILHQTAQASPRPEAMHNKLGARPKLTARASSLLNQQRSGSTVGVKGVLNEIHYLRAIYRLS